MRLFMALLGILGSAACAGRVTGAGDAGGAPEHDGSATHDAAHTHDTGPSLDTGLSNDCGAPAHVAYSCTQAMDAGADAAECHRYGGMYDEAPPDAAYMQGCSVTLPTCGSFGSQQCNCQVIPIGDGGPQWVCAL